MRRGQWLAAAVLPAVLMTSVVGIPARAEAPEPTTAPALVARPPQTAQIDNARVLPLTQRVYSLTDRAFPLMVRTASLDGALGRDEDADSERYTLSGDVFFGNDVADLTDRAREELAEIAEQLAEADPASVAIVGHTDTVGTDAHNDALSRARAEEVEKFLTAEVDGLQITTEGRGKRELLAAEEGTDEEIDAARALNRRVEITATYTAAEN